MTLLTRRSLLGGIGAVLAAPYIVRAASLMPVKAWADDPLGLAGIEIFRNEAATNSWWIPQHTVSGPVSRARMIAAIRRLCDEPPQIYAISPMYAALLKQ